MAHGSHQGRFGRIFPDLPAWNPGLPDRKATDRYLKDVADKLMVELEGKKPADIAQNQTMVCQLERKFNSTIPAGYTYFGQFIDHDITFDPASSLMRRNDPSELLNFRTPRLDLDSVYGAGPDVQPYLYDQRDKAKMAIGAIGDFQRKLPDLPRYNGRAVIGDMRNDENAIVSQLHLAFLLAHNALVNRVRKVDRITQCDREKGRQIFETTRKILRWLYQYIVWNDFMKRIVVEKVYNVALEKKKGLDGRTKWIAGFEDVYDRSRQPFMPVEFSVAAYRFGHSMVRNAYQTNSTRGVGQFAPLFDNTGDLRGFRPMTAKNSIQWDWFLEMESSKHPFPQKARRIDTKLSNALSFLPTNIAQDGVNVLALRNLLRGMSFDLPSGTAVARKWGLKPAKLEPQLGGKPAEPDALWYYILKEAEEQECGNRLGCVGSIIVAAVFAELLKGDPNSFFSMEPNWTPDKDPHLKGKNYNRDGKNGEWTLASIIRIAGLKADGIGFDEPASA